MNNDSAQDTLAQVLRYGRCTGTHCGGRGLAEEDHTCPYAEDINGDHTSLCNCCNECTRQCAYDI